MAASLANPVHTISHAASLSTYLTRSDTACSSNAVLGGSFSKHSLFYHGFIRRAELLQHVLSHDIKCECLSSVSRLFSRVNLLHFSVHSDNSIIIGVSKW